MPPLLWWCASILFLGGSIHQLISPLDALTVACIAIVPSLLILSWISTRVKPGSDESAAAADRLLGANSLFVSAWELSHSAAAIEGISRLLLARTKTELPGWSLYFKKQPRRYMKSTSLTATSLGLVGLFFLLLPPQVQTSEAPSTTTLSSQRKPFNQDKDPAAVLSELFMEKRATAAVEQNLQQNSRFDSAEGTDKQTSLQNKPEVMEKISENDSNTAGQTVIKMPGKPSTLYEKSLPAQDVFPVSASLGEGKKIADQTAGNEAAVNSGMKINKAEKFDQVRLIDIETGTDNQTTAFDSSQKGNELIASAPLPATLHQPSSYHPTKVAQTDSGTQLTAEQRVLVWRYFKQLEKINEQN